MNKIIKKIYILCFAMYVFNLIFNIYKYEFKYKSDTKNTMYEIMIIEKQKVYDNKISYVGKLGNDKFILNIYTKNKYDSNKNFSENKINEVNSYKYGDLLNVSGKIVIPENLGNIGEFDYRKYLNSKGIIGTINAYEVEHVGNKGNGLSKGIYKIRSYIESKIDNSFEENRANILKGMLYGNTKNIDDETKNKFENIGISHMTAVSGLNLNIFLAIILFAINREKTNKYLYFIIQLLAVIFYCLIAGLELSLLRAGIMTTIYSFCKIASKKITIEKTILLTLIIILYLNPYSIFNVGMILSFLATIGISIFYYKIYNFFESKICWHIKKKRVKGILLKLAVVLSITLSANILILPIVITTFNTFSLIFVISNTLLATLSTIIKMIGFIFVLLPKIPVIFSFAHFVLNNLLALFLGILNLLDKVSLKISVPSLPFYIILTYYLYIFFYYLQFKSKRKFTKTDVIKYRKRISYILYLSIIAWLIYHFYFNNYIYFFNVGQGEMAIIKKKVLL